MLIQKSIRQILKSAKVNKVFPYMLAKGFRSLALGGYEVPPCAAGAPARVLRAALLLREFCIWESSEVCSDLRIALQCTAGGAPRGA